MSAHIIVKRKTNISQRRIYYVEAIHSDCGRIFHPDDVILDVWAGR